jgi:hypothetical protein
MTKGIVRQERLRLTDVDARHLHGDLNTHEAIVFRIVFPRSADATAGRVSVLAPLGMAVRGRRAGDHVTWQTPGGLRRLRVDRVLYQPEREGHRGSALVGNPGATRERR